MNLPTRITFTNNRRITYKYDAAGIKLRKVVTDGANKTITYYMGGYQYQNDGEVKLQFFPTSEGYVKALYKEGEPDEPMAYAYVYNYTDHLGNIRLSYAYDKDTNEVKALEENHYYPFGLKHGFYNEELYEIALKQQTQNEKEVKQTVKKGYNYKYNGKELQDELGLNWYDYGARNYDGALGRFMSLDPLAEKYNYQSPYVYADNDPVRYIDLNGEGKEDIIIRARSKASGGDYVDMVIIRREGKDVTVNLDLDVDRAPLIDGVTGAEKPIVIGDMAGQQSPTSKSIIDKDADAFGVSITGSATYVGGAGIAKSVVVFFNGPDEGKVFQYDINMKNIGKELSEAIAVDNYFAEGSVNLFDRYSLTGNEVGIDASIYSPKSTRVSAGITGFMGVDSKNMNIPYYGYSKWLSFGIGKPIKAYASNSMLVGELTNDTTKNRQCFFCHNSNYYIK